MSISIAELRSMSHAELERRFDAEGARVELGLNFIYDEIKHRRLERLTRWITWMTGVITVATLVNVVLFAIR